MASARVMVICPKGVWTKVATNVKTATIHNKSNVPEQYSHNFALTGAGAPTAITDGIAYQTAVDFNNSVAIDIYIWCQGGAGLVGVDA